MCNQHTCVTIMLYAYSIWCDDDFHTSRRVAHTHNACAISHHRTDDRERDNPERHHNRLITTAANAIVDNRERELFAPDDALRVHTTHIRVYILFHMRATFAPPRRLVCPSILRRRRQQRGPLGRERLSAFIRSVFAVRAVWCVYVCGHCPDVVRTENRNCPDHCPNVRARHTHIHTKGLRTQLTHSFGIRIDIIIVDYLYNIAE